MSYTHQFGKDGYFGMGEGPDWPPVRKMPPGRDDISLTHPRRIARIAHLPDWTLSNEPPEVRQLCAEYLEKEDKRHAALVASGYYGQPGPQPKQKT